MKREVATFHNGLRMLSNPLKKFFEDAYLEVRSSEQRIYSLDVISKLPGVPADHLHREEWLVRKKSMERFLKYLKQGPDKNRILELGCGNGWLSAAIAHTFPHREVVGCDLNLFELKQAAGVFSHPNLSFVYADIFEEWPADLTGFDMVLLASSVQYFQDLQGLVRAISNICRKGAEIHFLDSPFYPQSALDEAAQRSRDYYKNLGFPQMANLYFHHSLQDLEQLEATFLYRPPSSVGKWLLPSSNPFYWAKVTV